MRLTHTSMLAILMSLMLIVACSGENETTAEATAQAGVDDVAVAPHASASGETAMTGNKTVAYYFHGNRRCATCKKLETYTIEAINEGFADLIESGELELRVVNTDEPENEHFVTDYELYTKSVVLINITDGEQVRWKNLAKIWDLVGEKEEFIKYVRQEVTYFVEDV